jgi:hypothetical protein
MGGSTLSGCKWCLLQKRYRSIDNKNISWAECFIFNFDQTIDFKQNCISLMWIWVFPIKCVVTAYSHYIEYYFSQFCLNPVLKKGLGNIFVNILNILEKKQRIKQQQQQQQRHTTCVVGYLNVIICFISIINWKIFF